MAKKVDMREFGQASLALCDWFKSQGIPPGEALCVMSLTMGALVAYELKDEVKMADAVEKCHQAVKKAANLAFKTKHTEH